VSLTVCIPDLLAKGIITPEQAKRAEEMFAENARDLRRSMSPDAADSVASSRTVEALEFEAARRRQNTLRQVNAQRSAEQWLRGGGENWGRGPRITPPDNPIPGARPEGPINPKAARTLLTRVDARRRAVEGEAFAHMNGILADHHSNVVGKLRNPAQMDEIGRAAFGEKVDSLAANELADGWFQASETVRQRANASGANIAKLERWGLPQSHDARALQQAGFEKWFADEAPRLDRSRMIDEDTGQPFTDAAFARAMRYAFESAVSDGALHRTPGAPGRSSAANQMGEHRFLHYKDYDAWKASREQYGTGTAYDAMMGHVKGMSRQVAAMEILGPNPDATIRYLKDVITGDEKLFEPGQLRTRDKAHGQAIAVQRLWDEYRGALRQPENRGIAAGFSTYRAIASSSKLGASAITASSDIGFGVATRHFNGLPVVSILGDYLKQFNPAKDGDRRTAASLGFIPETWTSMVAGQHRFLAEELTGEVSRRIADGVLRASGLNIFTDAGRSTNGMVWLRHLTNQRDKTYGGLEPAFRSALNRYGIDAAGWDAIRATPLETIGRRGWIRPENVADKELGNRIAEMAHNEGDFAVPVPDLETRAYMNANAKKGTVLGEMLRSSPLMFKTFTISTMIRHGGRMMDQPGVGGKLGYFVKLLIPVTIMGAVALQLKEIAKGHDPQSMDPRQNPGFWGHAMVTGGGAGIVGDLMGVFGDDQHQGAAQYGAGPLVSDVGTLGTTLLALGKNEAHRLGYNVKESPRAAWQLESLMRQNVPGQNLWYARLALDRLLADQLQSISDPEYHQSWNRMAQSARQRGQGFWWAPGQLAPSRAPDISTGLGSAPSSGQPTPPQ
jgi:hypothetical protein